MSSLIRLSALLSVCGSFLACTAPAEDAQPQEAALSAAKKSVAEYLCIVDPAGATESVVIRPSFGEVETTNSQGVWRSEDALTIVAGAKEVTVQRDGREVFKILGDAALVYQEPNGGRKGTCERFEVTKLAPVGTPFKVKGDGELAYTCTTSDGVVQLEVGPSYGEIAQLEFNSGATFFSDGLALTASHSKSANATKVVLKDGETNEVVMTIVERKGEITWTGVINSREGTGTSAGTCEKFNRKKTSR
jgi:hypothetical protein